MSRRAALVPAVLAALAALGCHGVLGLEAPHLGEIADEPPTCASGWTHRRRITVENDSGRKLLDHQLPIVLDTASLILAGTMRPDGHDVRVTLADGETLLPHVIEKDLGTTGTLLWTRAPFLPEGRSELLLHHGNPSAERRESVSDVFVPGIVVNPSFESAGGWSATSPPPETSRWTLSWPQGTAWTSDGASTLHVDLEQQTFTRTPIQMTVGQAVIFPAGTDHVVRFDIRIVALSGTTLGASLEWTASGGRGELWRAEGSRGNPTGIHVGQETIPIAPGATDLVFAATINDASGGYVKADVDNVRVR